MSKEDFDKTDKKKETYTPPCRKGSTSTTIRLTPYMDQRINEECEKLGMSRNGWLISIIDKELRRANLERMLEEDPFLAKKILCDPEDEPRM